MKTFTVTLAVLCSFTAAAQLSTSDLIAFKIKSVTTIVEGKDRTTRVYNQKGDIVASRRTNSNVELERSEYIYNQNDRLTEVRFFEKGVPVEVHRYIYDKDRLIQILVNDAAGQTKQNTFFEYDARGQKTRARIRTGTEMTQVVVYAYQNGKLISETTNHGATGKTEEKKEYKYNEQALVREEISTLPAEKRITTVKYTYNAANRLTEKNESSNKGTNATTRYNYSSTGMLQSEDFENVFGAKLRTHYTYEYF